MNFENPKINKFFLVQVIILNSIIVLMIIREVSRVFILNNNLKTNSQYLESIANIDTNENYTTLNEKYNTYLSKFSKENSLSDLIKSIENKTTKYNLEITQSKVIEVSDNQIKYEVTLAGNFDSIANFVKELEADTNPKEIVSSGAEIKNNKPEVKFLIRINKL